MDARSVGYSVYWIAGGCLPALALVVLVAIAFAVVFVEQFQLQLSLQVLDLSTKRHGQQLIAISIALK